MNWDVVERAIKLLTLVMEEVEQGSPNLIGGQSKGWAIFHWLCKRYDVPERISRDVLNGYLRWIT